MPTITTSGASGLDVNGLVTRLVAAERASYDRRIAGAEAELTTEFSAVAQLKGAMSSLQSSVGTLKNSADFQLRKVTLSADQFFTASTTAGAAPGTYQVEIRQLAGAAQLGSAAIVGGAGALSGTGTLNISLGAASFNVTLTNPTSTLANLRDAINDSANNPGVNAALVTDVNGAHLILGSSLTGASNTLKVTTSGGDGNLARFAYDPPGIVAMTQLTPPRDSIVIVSGYQINDPDLTIDGAIEGVSLSLKKAETGTTTAMGISIDNAGIRDKVGRFVSAFNVLANQIAKLRSYNPETKAAGPLLGDAMLRGIESQISRMISDPVSGLGSSDYTTLASVGITREANGSLKLDTAKFDAAVAREPGAVSRLFTSQGGLSARMGDYIEARLNEDGEIAARDATIAARRKDIDKQKQVLDARMATYEARYRKQFNSLDGLLTRLQSTSSYLTQQLANLPNYK
jgi:flagellar hook-associated protein 2